MSLEDFRKDPDRNVHAVYRKSLFSPTATEQATGEVLLGSTYRKLLLNDHADSKVDLTKIEALADVMPPATGGSDLWKQLLIASGGISSPARKGQAGGQPQLMPLVPEIGWHGCVIGTSGRSRWYPANLLLEVIGAGRGPAGGQRLLNRLRKELEVDSDDDLFARFVARSLDRVKPLPSPQAALMIEEEHTRAYRGSATAESPLAPAERFCSDLEAVLAIKCQLTRRQWTVLVEALLRIGLTSYILWICHVNSTCWRWVLSVAEGNAPPSEDQIVDSLFRAHARTGPFLEVGHDGVPMIKQAIESYAHARYGLNLLLHKLEESSTGLPTTSGNILAYSPQTNAPLSTVIRQFLEYIAVHRNEIASPNAATWLRAECASLLDKDPGLLRAASGFTRNMYFFVAYTLGQTETKDTEQRSYDQSYLLVKRGRSVSAGRPRESWPVVPGPAMLVLLVHAVCRALGDIPASVEDFRTHVAEYGLRVPAGELATGRIGADLEKLGLIVDSPDAAGGRLLVAPFPVA